MKRVNQQILLFIITLFLISGCLITEDNSPTEDVQDYWTSDVNTKESFVSKLRNESITCNGGVFYSDNTDQNITKFGDFAILSIYQVSKARITSEQFAAFLNNIACGEDGFFMGQKYFEPSSIIQYNSDNDKGQFYGENFQPMLNVTWIGALAFCKWAGGRLPTETEWRNANQLEDKYGNKELLGIYGSSVENDYNSTNTYSSEWCFDWYKSNYQFEGIASNPQGPNSGTERVVFSTTAEATNEARFGLESKQSLQNIGFRCVWNLESNITDDLAITTTEVKEISSTTAVLGSQISKDGGATASVLTILLWDSIPNPNLNRCIGLVKSKAGEHNFSASISGLDFDKTYYVVSYAINTAGVSVGNEVSFTTIPAMLGYENGTIEFEQVYIKGGSYNSNGIEVNLNSFSIGKYEITNKQFCVYLNAIGATNVSDYLTDNKYIEGKSLQWVTSTGFENYPVCNVIWTKAIEFCKWVGGRLPDKNEWEYAAKCGQLNLSFPYSGSNKIDDVCWCKTNSYNFHNDQFSIHPIGQKLPNAIGIYDMSGNVAEWCSNINGSSQALNKGGSFIDPVENCKIEYDRYSFQYSSNDQIGFRLLLEEDIFQ
ncbi:MAG: formylglycine-generating enzyme family protein [Prolixibacteraceae bacterium]